MTSALVRDPFGDHHIRPEVDQRFLMIDYPPSQLAGSARWITRC